MKILSLPFLFTIATIVHEEIVQGQQQLSSSSCGVFAPPAEIYWQKFFNTYSGDYLPIKGINYYPRPNEGALT